MVRLPTKMERNQLGSSRLSAEQRSHAIERRFERDPQLQVQYHSFMKEYEDLGHMEPVKSQEEKTTCYFYHIIQASWKQVSQQALRLHLVEVPSLLTAPNNITDESQLGTDSSIILTRIQGPPSKWETSVGNRVTITKKPLQKYGDVPSQSNPGALISRGTEPSTLPYHGGRDHTGHHRSFQVGQPQRSLLQTTW